MLDRKCVFDVVACLMLFVSALSLRAENKGVYESLSDSIADIVSECPGEIGIALIIDNKDTVTVRNESIYPMMSVFKLHQALAVCRRLDREGTSLDSVISVRRDWLDPATWSPMLKEYTGAVIELPISELLRYAIMQSDNNASNVLFGHIAGVCETDSFIATLIPRPSFRIAYTESEMAKDHDKAYANYTSPLGAAMLINRVFCDSLVSSEKQEFIKSALRECTTGKDRIAAPLAGRGDVGLAHKTGSGYTKNGVLTAHNDVGFITLPDGRHYALAVFVKDFSGTEAQASGYIARISAAVYSMLGN